MIATDFFTVDTVRRTTLDGLFVIGLGTQRVRLVDVTDHPNGMWVMQRARESWMRQADGGVVPRLLIHDRDSKFIRAFDEAFRADGIRIIRHRSRRRTPTPSPSGGCEPSGKGVWTGSWCGTGASWSGCLTKTFGTTTTNGRIDAVAFAPGGWRCRDCAWCGHGRGQRPSL
jgi:hypothetical protein